MSSPYSSTSQKIIKTPTPIRYVELTEDMFVGESVATGPSPKPSFQTSFEKLALSPGEYLGPQTNLANLNPLSSDTTVLNFQVGTGKTQVLFDYIKQYLDLGDEYTVFYCAPFLRLLSEITRELEKRKISYFDCTKILRAAEESDFATLENMDQQVQLMTPDFLLSSGGSRSARQSGNKTTYKDRLREHMRRKGRKIVLIIDEIHEKPSVFASQHLPYLLQWHGIVHKTFIASATFTRDSVEVVKAVSFLTKRRIAVFQADRIKGPVQARLHLHFCTQEYSEKDLAPLAGFAEVIEQNSTRPVHILTAYKSVAKRLYEGKGSAAAEAIGRVAPKLRLLTAESKTPFVETRSSIGTTFKTGVNIRNPNGLLLVILPSSKGDSIIPPKLGTFSDIRSSVVQAFARMRNGGDIHVFMPPLTAYILGGGFLRWTFDHHQFQQLAKGELEYAEAYRDEHKVFEEFRALYQQRQDLLNDFRNSTDSETRDSYDKMVGFEGLYDYLLFEYPHYKDASLDAAGQGLSALILWMACHEQFTNCSLESVTLEEYKPTTSSLPTGKMLVELFQEKIAGQLPSPLPSSFFDLIELVLELLETDRGGSGQILRYKLPPSSSPVREGTIRELYSGNGTIAGAIFQVVLSLLPHPPKKKDSFMLLVNHAKGHPGPSQVDPQGYYTRVKQALEDSRTSVAGTAKLIGKSRYLAAKYEDNLPQGVLDTVAKLVDALETAAAHDPLLNFGIVQMPSQSSQSKKALTIDDYRKTAFQLVRQKLGLIKKQPSRIGSKSILGVNTPHFKLPAHPSI